MITKEQIRFDVRCLIDHVGFYVYASYKNKECLIRLTTPLELTDIEKIKDEITVKFNEDRKRKTIRAKKK